LVIFFWFLRIFKLYKEKNNTNEDCNQKNDKKKKKSYLHNKNALFKIATSLYHGFGEGVYFWLPLELEFIPSWRRRNEPVFVLLQRFDFLQQNRYDEDG